MIEPLDNPWMHFETPVHIATFVVKAVNNSSLIGSTFCDAFREGLDPVNGTQWAGDTLGESYEINTEYACLHFGLLPYKAAVSGTKYDDFNGNCIQDPGEAGLPGWTIIANPGGYASTTGPDGEYFIGVPNAGNYEIREITKEYWAQTCPSTPNSYEITLFEGDIAENLDFGNRVAVNFKIWRFW